MGARGLAAEIGFVEEVEVEFSEPLSQRKNPSCLFPPPRSCSRRADEGGKQLKLNTRGNAKKSGCYSVPAGVRNGDESSSAATFGVTAPRMLRLWTWRTWESGFRGL